MVSRRTFLRAGVGTVALSGVSAGVDARTQDGPTTDWTATYEPDEGRALSGPFDSDGDGGYWLAGTQFADGTNEAIWLVPVSADGSVGQVTTTDRVGTPLLSDLTRTSAGGAVVAGSGYKQGPWAVRYAADGTEQWYAEPTLDDQGSHTVGAVVAREGADDGGHLLVGTRLDEESTRPDAGWVGHLTADGAVASTATVEGRLALRDATPTGGGEVFAVGRAVTDDAAWLGVLAPDGRVRWEQTLADLGGQGVLEATTCAPLGDGYVVGAYGGSSVSEDQPTVVGVGPDGAVRWHAFAPGPGAPGSVAPTESGVFAVGDSPLQTTDVQSWAAWTTGEGERRWRATYTDDRRAVAAVGDGAGVVVAGRSGSAARVRRLSLPASAEDTTTAASEGDDANPTAGGDETGSGGLPLPGFGVGAAVAGGVAGVAELYRRRDQD